MHPALVLELVLLLLAIAVTLAVVARLLRVPPAVAFVPGGMALALAPGVPAFTLDPRLSLMLFLPPLLLSSAYFTVWRDFRANLRPILLLAIGAVVFSAFVIGWITKALVPTLPWAACVTLGAIVSPPDIVAAKAVLDRLHLPRQLLVVLEGESLVNDASGLVLYQFAAGAALGQRLEAGHIAASFFLIVLGGLGIGIVCGRVLTWVMRRLGDPRLEITASFLGAWGSYVLADFAGTSGVLSTVACGLVLGAYQHEAFSSVTREQARAAWDFVGFVVEALIFVLIGLALHGVILRPGWGPKLSLMPIALAVTGAVIAARFAWVFPATYLFRLPWPGGMREPAPRPAVPLLISWTAMRGVVSLAAALGLPADFPGHDLILFVTACVIVGTVMIEGPTVAPLVRLLRLEEAAPEEAILDEAPARAAMARAALHTLERRSTDPRTGAAARDLLPEFRAAVQRAGRIHEGGAALTERHARLGLRLEALAAARGELLRLFREERIHETVLYTLEQELDLEEIRLRSQMD